MVVGAPHALEFGEPEGEAIDGRDDLGVVGEKIILGEENQLIGSPPDPGFLILFPLVRRTTGEGAGVGLQAGLDRAVIRIAGLHAGEEGERIDGIGVAEPAFR